MSLRRGNLLSNAGVRLPHFSPTDFVRNDKTKTVIARSVATWQSLSYAEERLPHFSPTDFVRNDSRCCWSFFLVLSLRGAKRRGNLLSNAEERLPHFSPTDFVRNDKTVQKLTKLKLHYCPFKNKKPSLQTDASNDG